MKKINKVHNVQPHINKLKHVYLAEIQQLGTGNKSLFTNNLLFFCQLASSVLFIPHDY